MMKTIWFIFRPNHIRIILTVILILVSTSVSMWGEATSKVTWNANRGFPFSFITISDRVENVYGNNYCLQNNICLETNIQKFYPYELLLDILVWYLVSCLIVFVYAVVKRHSSFLQPNFVKILLLIIIMAITSIIVDYPVLPSVATWNENRGIPFSFIELFIRDPTIFGGKVCPLKGLCLDIYINHFYPYAFLLDILLWYLVSCALTHIFKTFKNQHYIKILGSR